MQVRSWLEDLITRAQVDFRAFSSEERALHEIVEALSVEMRLGHRDSALFRAWKDWHAESFDSLECVVLLQVVNHGHVEYLAFILVSVVARAQLGEFIIGDLGKLVLNYFDASPALVINLVGRDLWCVFLACLLGRVQSHPPVISSCKRWIFWLIWSVENFLGVRLEKAFFLGLSFCFSLFVKTFVNVSLKVPWGGCALRLWNRFE